MEEMRMTQLTYRIFPQGLKLKWCDWVVLVEDGSIPMSPCLPHTPSKFTPPRSTVIDSLPRGCNPWTLRFKWTLFLPFLIPPHLPPTSANFPFGGWHHRLWQENKSVSGRCRLASEGRPWQLSINSPRLFFFFSFLFLISDGRRWNPAVSITGAY